MNMKKLDYNQDFIDREKIIFGKQVFYNGVDSTHYKSYKDLSLESLEKLIERNHIDLNDCQNDSPSANEFYEFMKKYPGVTAHGYIIGPDRNDYRTTIEGIEFKGECTIDMICDFISMCKNTNDLYVNKNFLRCWYD